MDSWDLVRKIYKDSYDWDWFELPTRNKPYLHYAPDDEGIRVFYDESTNIKPVSHTVYEGDFMGMCKHDIPCMVCYSNSAIVERDMSIGVTVPAYKRFSAQPCSHCQFNGFRVVKVPKWLRGWLR